MSDDMTGWERMLAEQATELAKLRGFLADYEAALKAMRSAVALAMASAGAVASADRARSERLREALRVVRARIDRTVAAGWRSYENATGVEKYPGTLLEYVTLALDENATSPCADVGTSVGRDEADKPNHLNDSGFRG